MVKTSAHVSFVYIHTNCWSVNKSTEAAEVATVILYILSGVQVHKAKNMIAKAPSNTGTASICYISILGIVRDITMPRRGPRTFAIYKTGNNLNTHTSSSFKNNSQGTLEMVLDQDYYVNFGSRRLFIFLLN